jgi:hypothetical protein
MKKIACVVFLGLISITLANCGERVVNERRMIIEKDKSYVQFVINGYVNLLFTTEGTYPPWSDNLVIFLNDPEKLKYFSDTPQNYVFEHPRDFSDRYSYVSSGNVTIDTNESKVLLKLKFLPDVSYKSVLNGTYFLPK